MKSKNTTLRIALGAVGGIIGTAVLFSALTANKKLFPEDEAPLREDPGEFMVETAEKTALTKKAQAEVPKIAEMVAANALHFSYGASGGALYALLRPRSKNPLLEGTALGLGIWAVGYLGWLPAVGLLPPVTEQKPMQIFSPVWQHALYGIVTVAAYRRLKNSTD